MKKWMEKTMEEQEVPVPVPEETDYGNEGSPEEYYED